MSTNKKILLVLEDQHLDKILTYLLKAWGYEVLLCRDAREALALAAGKHPDLILIDAHLESTDGLRLCKDLKDDFLTAYIPVVILIEKKQLRRSLLDIEQGVDDFLIKPPDPIDLEIRIALSLKNADHQFHANALTKLPGNRSIEKHARQLLGRQEAFSFAYCDINNFKSFNDKYGYITGDRAILQTAKILASSIKRLGNPEDFVGHVGGDDFVYISTPEKTETIARECVSEFDRLMPFHYATEDRHNGFIRVRDRRGQMRSVPLMGLSVSIVNYPALPAYSIHELIATAFEIKKFLKIHPNSNYLINRRTDDKGIERRQALDEAYEEELRAHRPVPRRRLPIGQRMLATRLINEEQLNEVLAHHWQSGQRLGEAAVTLGFATHAEIDQLLEQSRVPVHRSRLS